MGETAEFLATKYNVSRETQDIFALNSQLATEQAMINGYFKKEIIPVPVKKSRNEEGKNKYRKNKTACVIITFLQF